MHGDTDAFNDLLQPHIVDQGLRTIRCAPIAITLRSSLALEKLKREEKSNQMRTKNQVDLSLAGY